MEKWRIYLQEAMTQVTFANLSYTQFENASASGNVRNVFFHLHHFILHAANIDKLLDIKQRADRNRILSGKIDVVSFDLKSIRRLRNHLEHFDERLDQWIRDFDGHAFFDMNIVTGAKGFPEKAFLRALDGSTFKFYGENFSLTEVRSEIQVVESWLSSVLEAPQ